MKSFGCRCVTDLDVRRSVERRRSSLRPSSSPPPTPVMNARTNQFVFAISTSFFSVVKSIFDFISDAVFSSFIFVCVLFHHMTVTQSSINKMEMKHEEIGLNKQSLVILV